MRFVMKSVSSEEVGERSGGWPRYRAMLADFIFTLVVAGLALAFTFKFCCVRRPSISRTLTGEPTGQAPYTYAVDVAAPALAVGLEPMPAARIFCFTSGLSLEGGATMRNECMRIFGYVPGMSMALRLIGANGESETDPESAAPRNRRDTCGAESRTAPL